MKKPETTNSFSLLSHWAQAGVAYLHPGGGHFTSWLIEQLQPAPGMHVLEIGCGTGATLADMALLPQLRLTGVDASPAMLKIAQERMMHCQLSEMVNLVQVHPAQPLPFSDNHFDHAYAESVLGIMEPHILTTTLAEIHRVLKPGGLLITNDAIWKNEATAQAIAHTNEQCLRYWGIIQSCSNPATAHQWQQLFEQHHFICHQAIEADHLPGTTSTVAVNATSAQFTRQKRKRALFNPRFVFNELRVRWLLKTHGKTDKRLIHNYLFVLKKEQKYNG